MSFGKADPELHNIDRSCLRLAVAEVEHHRLWVENAVRDLMVGVDSPHGERGIHDRDSRLGTNGSEAFRIDEVIHHRAERQLNPKQVG